ncbi:MAG: hypothetical protein V1904_04870 [Bacteroidota bacterium]
MNRLKFLFLGFLLIILLNEPYAQKDNKGSGNELIHKFFTGGSLGLQFGSYTYINVAPIIGYRFNEYIACGIGPNYTFYHSKDYYYYPPVIYSTHLYGGNFFTRVYFLKDIIPSIKDIYVHGEIEALNVETQYFDYSLSHPGKRYWVGSVFGGAGIRQMLGERVFSTITVLFNFNETIDSPYYGNPLVYRVGIEINL